MTQSVLMLILITSILSFAVCGQTPPNKYEVKEVTEIVIPTRSPKSYFDEGMKYYKEGYYDEAVKVFSKLIKKHPNYIRAYFQRGSVYDDLGNYTLAIKDFTKVIEVNPKNVLALSLRGKCYFDQSDYPKSLKDYERAIQINASYEPAVYTIGRIYQETAKHKKALTYFRRSLELDKRGGIYYSIGMSKKALGDLTGACEALKKGAEMGNANAKEEWQIHCKK